MLEKLYWKIIKSINQIKNQPDPIGEILENWEQPNGLKFSKISVPLGVLGVIYESKILIKRIL